MHTLIDLRSDTVTRPSVAMRKAMVEAPLGDDVLGDDPTVIRLQERVAELMGKEAAVFMPSGTMANQAAIRAHTEPGDEVIAHRDSHIIHYETGAPAALSGVMIRPLDGPMGRFTGRDVEEAVRPVSSHFARSALVVVENTHNRGGGGAWSVDECAGVARAARKHKLKLHLDGARLWNACIAQGEQPATYAAMFDTVSCCFSKGLGSPAGSAVCGDAPTIARIHRFRKMFGGAMRQAGVLAAAALYALENNRDRLIEDHRRAAALAEIVSAIPGLRLAMPVTTNMVFFDVDLGGAPEATAAAVCESLREHHGVLMLPSGPQRIRAVTHLDVSAPMVETAGEALRSVMDALGGSKRVQARLTA